MQHFCFFFSNKPRSARGQFLILEKGAAKMLHVCLITRKLLITSLSANNLILVPRPKLSMVVIACPSHPTLSLCWVSASKSILPYSGKPFDFFPRPCMWGEKKKANPSPCFFTGGIPMSVLWQRQGAEGVWTPGYASVVIHSHLTFSCPPFLWLLGRHCSVHLVAGCHAWEFAQVSYAAPKAALWQPRRPEKAW